MVTDKYFTHGSYDILDNCSLQFYDCVIQKSFGPHKVGDEVPTIAVFFETSIVITYDDTDAETYKEKFSINLE